MTIVYSLLNLTHWASAILLLGLAAYSLRHLHVPAVKPLIIFLLLSTLWAVFAALIPLVDDFETKIFLTRIRLTAPVLLPLCILAIALSLHGKRRLARWLIPIFAIIPIATFALLMSPFYEKFIGDFKLLNWGTEVVLSFTNGPWFKVHNIHARIVALVSLILIFTSSRDHNPYHRSKSWLICLAITFPYLADTIIVTAFPFLRYLQVTPSLLGISALVLAYAIFGLKILSLVPVARSNILDSSDELYLVFDLERRLVDFNVRASHVLGLVSKQMGFSAEKVLSTHPQLLDQFQNESNRARPYTVGTRTYEIVVQDVLDSNSTKIGRLLLCKDITLQLQIESELKEINMMKTKLLATMGHDLQGTLSGLALSADSLIASTDPELHGDRMALLEFMKEASKSCVTLVDQLLLWSKSQLGADLTFIEDFDVGSVMAEVLSFMQPALVDKGIDVFTNCPASLSIKSDKNVFRTILRNLMSNAVKFSPLESAISIVVEDRHDQIQVTVKDSGPGIGAHVRSSLFELQPARISGMGLYLCSEFIKKLGGKIWSEAGIDVGSEFCFTIPKLNGTVRRG